MNKLADDVEPSVRAELMEQVPHIAMYCQEFKAKLAHVVPETLLPMVVKFLTDVNIQVRKTSQAALLVLLEQGLVEKSDVQEQVCPVILRLTEADALDDHRTEAVAVSNVTACTLFYCIYYVYVPIFCLLSRLISAMYTFFRNIITFLYAQWAKIRKKRAILGKMRGT
jgi:hypothetical protein